MMALASALAVGAAIAGLYLSYWLDVASGATIVLVQTGLFLVVLALGPRTGLLARRRPGPSAQEAGTIG
jgi:ABC-type Mn2+/Zn2+ transport system permease subunit